MCVFFWSGMFFISFLRTESKKKPKRGGRHHERKHERNEANADVMNAAKTTFPALIFFGRVLFFSRQVAGQSSPRDDHVDDDDSRAV